MNGRRPRGPRSYGRSGPRGSAAAGDPDALRSGSPARPWWSPRRGRLSFPAGLRGPRPNWRSSPPVRRGSVPKGPRCAARSRRRRGRRRSAAPSAWCASSGRAGW